MNRWAFCRLSLERIAMYFVVSIGNTDNRLTQQEWNTFVQEMGKIVEEAGKVHFMGGASTWAPWQNVAWIIELQAAPIAIMSEVSRIREKYNQDSAFVMVSEGMFV